MASRWSAGGFGLDGQQIDMAAFNVFDVMKKSPPRQKGETSSFMSIAEAIDTMDKLASILIASNIQWKTGNQRTFAHSSDMKSINENARKAALFIYSEEQKGSLLIREFSAECWSELIAITSVAEVQSFCQSTSMNPSVLCRIILTEKQ